MTPSPSSPFSVIAPVYSPPLMTVVGYVTVAGLWGAARVAPAAWRTGKRPVRTKWQTGARSPRVVWKD